MHYTLHLVSALSENEQRTRFNAIETWFKNKARENGIKNVRIQSNRKTKKKLIFCSGTKAFECFIIKENDGRIAVNVTNDPIGIKIILSEIFCDIFKAEVQTSKARHTPNKENILKMRIA